MPHLLVSVGTVHCKLAASRQKQTLKQTLKPPKGPNSDQSPIGVHQCLVDFSQSTRSSQCAIRVRTESGVVRILVPLCTNIQNNGICKCLNETLPLLVKNFGKFVVVDYKIIG